MFDISTASIKYGFVVCPAINQIRTRSRFLNSDNRLPYAFASMMMEYGYVPSKKMFNDLMYMDDIEVSQIFNHLKSCLETITSKKIIQSSRVFYENFPNVPFNLFEQRLLAIAHYYSHGTFFPSDVKLTQKEKREVRIDEKASFKELSFITMEEVRDFVFDKLLCSKNTLPIDDIEYIKNVIFEMGESKDGFISSSIFDNIVNKEILAIFVASLLKAKDLSNIGFFILKSGKFSVTDVLRIATALCDGDVSLAENTKFKLNRKHRKFLCDMLLQTNLSFDEIIAHKNKWVKLLHCLHIGEYSLKLHKWAMSVREKIKIVTFNSYLEDCFKECKENPEDIENWNFLIDHLEKKPSLFIRNFSRILKILSDTNNSLKIVNYVNKRFEEIVMKSDIPNRILYQFYSYVITDSIENRVFFPKGMKTKFYIEKDRYIHPTIFKTFKSFYESVIFNKLKDNFSKLGPMGSVYIDPSLFRASINNGLRNVTPGKQIVSRGCKIPFEAEKALRMFMFWIGNDLDLAASFMDKNFNKISECSFRQTINNFSQHSGDITYAPSPGSSEYVDIDINKALSFGVRYVGMHIFSYSGEKFKDLEKCCVGWMERSCPNSNEMYEPKTVKQYIDLTGNARTYTPVIFDLVEKTVCFIDMNGQPNGAGFHLGKQGYDQNALFKSTVQKKSLSLGDLICLHVEGRNGSITNNPEEADYVFSMDKGITPYDYIELEKWM